MSSARRVGSVGDPFDLTELRIKQPGRVFPERAAYDIFDDRHRQVAVVRETKGRSRFEALAQEVPSARTFAVTTPRHEPLLTLALRDEWRAELTDSGGALIGRIRVAANRRQYTLLDSEETVVGEATGELSLTKFAVTGPAGEPYAQLRKTWAGLGKEIFTESDDYTVTFTGPVAPPLRPLIVMTAIVIDISVHGPY
jgi:Scramblase